MNFGLHWDVWEPIYQAIRQEFGFDADADADSRELLRELCGSDGLTPRDVPSAANCRVGIAGGAATLTDELERLRDVDRVFAASTATAVLGREGIDVDLHVTDLDKDEDTTVHRTREEKPVALHAHGDNRARIREHANRMDFQWILPTTQVEPDGPVVNPGGFTDGDRAAFLADALGATDLVFAGWDFEDPSVSRVKRAKLRWAERLLHWLERRRGQRFDVLAGRRRAIDIDELPDPRHE